MNTPHSITIYHKTVAGGQEAWTRQPVPNVMWEDSKAANVLRSGLLEADRVTVYVPFSSAPGGLIVAVGDVLVKGQVSDTISPSFTITQLMAKYPNVVTVRSVDTMDYGSPSMQHWQIGGA